MTAVRNRPTTIREDNSDRFVVRAVAANKNTLIKGIWFTVIEVVPNMPGYV